MRTTFIYALNIFNANFIPLFVEHNPKRWITESIQPGFYTVHGTNATCAMKNKHFSCTGEMTRSSFASSHQHTIVTVMCLKKLFLKDPVRNPK